MSSEYINLVDPEGRFSRAEKDSIETRAKLMIERDEVRTYFKVGPHDVCLERDSADVKTISAYLMNGTMEQNEKVVTRHNKRK